MKAPSWPLATWPPSLQNKRNKKKNPLWSPSRAQNIYNISVGTKWKEYITFAPKDRKHWNYWRQGWRRRLLLDQWEIRIAADLHANDTLWRRRRDEAVWGVSVFTLLLSPVCTREIHLYILAEKLKNRRMVRKYDHFSVKHCPPDILLPLHLCTYYGDSTGSKGFHLC